MIYIELFVSFLLIGFTSFGGMSMIPLINAEMLSKVWDEIASAPAESYKAFVLYYYLDMTVADIARELSLSESAVKSRIHRLRASVRQKLAKEWQA